MDTTRHTAAGENTQPCNIPLILTVQGLNILWVSHEISDVQWEELSVLNEVAEKGQEKEGIKTEKQKLKVC